MCYYTYDLYVCNAMVEMNQEVNQDGLKSRLKKLKDEHRALDAEIDRVRAQPLHDQLAVQRMKKRKLQLKDEIIQIESRMLPDIIA